MLAWLLRAYYLFHVLLGASLGLLLAPTGQPPALAGLLGAGLWLLILQAGIIAFSMAVSARWCAGVSALSRWRALAGELRAALTVYMLRQLWAGRAHGVLAPLHPAATRPLPVVLVHGHLCNHRVWDPVQKALRRAGHSVIAVDLEPVFGSIDNYSPIIEQAVARLMQTTGAAQVALVGHSMGGLAIRAWMRDFGTARVARVITLGTPHQGTQLASMAFSANAAQMIWHSPWLQQLQQSETASTHALMHLALTTHDNIVFPQREQTLPGAAVTVFEGLGHLQLCLNPQVIGWLCAQLAAPAAAVTPDAPAAVQRPASVRALFWAFTLLALQGFGGVVAIVQRELVERKRWLTSAQFVEDWAVSQVLPGPNVVNLCLMIGDRYFGWRGGLAALAGLLSFPLLIVLLLAVLLAGVSDLPAVQGALRGMGAVAAGMITATGIKLVASLSQNVLGKLLCYAISALTFAAVALLHVPLIWVLGGLGGGACLLAYRRLAPAAAAPARELP